MKRKSITFDVPLSSQSECYQVHSMLAWSLMVERRERGDVGFDGPDVPIDQTEDHPPNDRGAEYFEVQGRGIHLALSAEPPPPPPHYVPNALHRAL
jgi:hypothetical protein